MEGWIEFTVWAALVGIGVWLVRRRETEPRWVRILERVLPVRGCWARRLLAAPALVMSLFPLANGCVLGDGHTFLVLAGHWSPCLGCMVALPPAGQGFSYSAHSWYGRLCQLWTLRIGGWELQVCQFADVDAT